MQKGASAALAMLAEAWDLPTQRSSPLPHRCAPKTPGICSHAQSLPAPHQVVSILGGECKWDPPMLHTRLMITQKKLCKFVDNSGRHSYEGE